MGFLHFKRERERVSLCSSYSNASDFKCVDYHYNALIKSSIENWREGPKKKEGEDKLAACVHMSGAQKCGSKGCQGSG